MWKYREVDAYKSISLHDCKVNKIEVDEDSLIFHFPDGFWITPVSEHIDHDRPLKTGPSQLRFYNFGQWSPLELVDVEIYKSTYLFRKRILCRKVEPEFDAFMKMINSQKYELEFLYEFHSAMCSLYKCWLWKTNHGMDSECQLEIYAAHMEYCWNEILPDHEW